MIPTILSEELDRLAKAVDLATMTALCGYPFAVQIAAMQRAIELMIQRVPPLLNEDDREEPI